jgi:uncharacterized protein
MESSKPFPDSTINDGDSMLCFDDALKLLSRYGGDSPWVRHCLAVSRVADRVASLIARNHVIDARLLTVGALLHDVGRYKTHDPVLHGVEGYRLLSDLGHEREAFICASHIFCGMPRHEAVLYGLPEKDFLPRTLEERLIPLIDGVVELDRPTTVEARVKSINKRYQNNPVFLKRFEQAAELAQSYDRMVSQDFGLCIEEIAAEVLEKRNTE